MQQEYRQHEAKSAATVVSGIRGDTLSMFPRPGWLRPLASRRATTSQMNRQIRKEHNSSNTTAREGWLMNLETPQIMKPTGERYMQRVHAILSASGLVLALSLPSWAQVNQLPTHTVTLSGTVETIDQGRRTVNIKTADGKFETVDVPQSAQRFSELKVGDKVSAT